MLHKLKQIKQMRKIQKELGKEKTDAEKNGVRVTINGNMQIESVLLNPNLDNNTQEKMVKECVNEAVRKIQFVVAQRMSDFGSFGLN